MGFSLSANNRGDIECYIDLVCVKMGAIISIF